MTRMHNLTLLARACEWISDRFFDLSRYIEDKSWGYRPLRSTSIERAISKTQQHIVLGLNEKLYTTSNKYWMSDPGETQKWKDTNLIESMPILAVLKNQCKKGDSLDDTTYQWKPIWATIIMDKDVT